jgi:ATPase subunit of ABC transporter with duplicated ATPase domains
MPRRDAAEQTTAVTAASRNGDTRRVNTRKLPPTPPIETSWSSAFSSMPDGNRQKVQLVAAFASRADLLILDEPTGGLDPDAVRRDAVLQRCAATTRSRQATLVFSRTGLRS